MFVLQVAEFQLLGAWFLAFWQRLVLLFGWGRPPGESGPAVAEQPAECFAQPRDLGFETVLPGLTGRVVLPWGPGYSIIPLRQVTVAELFGGFQSLAEMREQWPFAGEAGGFAAYVALDGPGWDLTVVFGSESTGKVEYFARKAGGGRPVSGVAGWVTLAEALMLSPDYEAVVGFLTMGPYWTEFNAA